MPGFPDEHPWMDWRLRMRPSYVRRATDNSNEIGPSQSRNNMKNPCDLRPHDADGQEQDDYVVATCWRSVVIIETVELVALPNAPEWQEKVYRAHLDSGDSVDLFQTHWDVPLPPESLVGLTIEAARKMRIERILAAATGH
jgi:hypothetical protein